MYIGSTGERGLHHLVYEVVDNSVDEALAGFCDHIEITLLENGGCRVSDNGRGIPGGYSPHRRTSRSPSVMTVLHAGGKFGSGGYAVSGGLHGVGVSVVNALSTRMDTEVRRDGYVWRISYERRAVAPLEKVEPTTKPAPQKLSGPTAIFSRPSISTLRLCGTASSEWLHSTGLQPPHRRARTGRSPRSEK